MSKSINIAVVNAAFAGNKGAEAMLVKLILSLANEFKNAAFYIEKELRSTEIDKIIEEQIGSINQTGISASSFTFVPRHTLINIFRGYKNKEGKIRPDIVIDIGGLSFTDSSLRGSIRSLLKALPFLVRKTPLIYFTQDFGPMEKKLTRFIAKMVLKRAASIFTRSSESYDLLKVLLKRKNIFGPYPDSTLLLDGLEYKIAGLDNEKYVVISPSLVMRRKQGESYIKKLVDTANEFNDEYKIVVLNHAFGLNTYGGDESVCEELYENLKDVILVNENIDTRYLKNIISGARFVVSSRYHVIVAALSKNVPAIALGWNPKYKNFLGLYEREKYNLEFNEELPSNVTSLVPQMTNPEEAKHLEKKNALLKERVRESFSLLISQVKEITKVN